MVPEEFPLLPEKLPESAPSASLDAAPADPDASDSEPVPIELRSSTNLSLDPDLVAQMKLLETPALSKWSSGSSSFADVPSPLRVTPGEPPRRSPRLRTCFTVGIVALLIFALMASSIFSLYWFWTARGQRVAEVAALATQVLHHEPPTPRSSASAAAKSTPDQVEGSLAKPASEPVNRIVITNDRSEIETMAPDGSERRVLAADDRAYQMPAWSPDGRFIASVGGSISGGGIYRMADIDAAGDPEEVFFSRTQSPFYLYWSPDGEQISFLASSRANGMELNVVPSSGGESRVVAFGSPMYWNWTPDSHQMLIHSGDTSENARIALIDDQGETQLPPLPAPGYFQAPGISASGRYWAYSEVRAGDTNWLVTYDHLNNSQNGHRHAGAVALSWSPVGESIAYISGDPDSQFSSWGPLRVLDATTGETRILSKDMVLAFFWSPDGRKIATISLPGEPLLGDQFEVRSDPSLQAVRYEPASSSPVPVQNHGHIFRISVIDVASGEGDILTEQLLSPAFLSQFLPYFDQYSLSHNIWSPASDAIVLPIIKDRQSQIAVLDVINGHIKTLAEGQMGFWSWQ